MAKGNCTYNSCFRVVAFGSTVVFAIARFPHVHTEITPGSLSCREGLRKSHHKITTGSLAVVGS